MVSSLSQWISYEDAESFSRKLGLLMSRCLKGFAVWSLDLDTQDNQALTAVLGEHAMVRAFVENRLSVDERTRLVDDLAAYTGQNCYVTMACGESCKPDYLAVETAHLPKQIGKTGAVLECDEGDWHNICCPKKALPANCEWRGAPEQVR